MQARGHAKLRSVCFRRNDKLLVCSTCTLQPGFVIGSTILRTFPFKEHAVSDICIGCWYARRRPWTWLHTLSARWEKQHGISPAGYKNDESCTVQAQMYTIHQWLGQFNSRISTNFMVNIDCTEWALQLCKWMNVWFQPTYSINHETTMAPTHLTDTCTMTRVLRAHLGLLHNFTEFSRLTLWESGVQD